MTFKENDKMKFLFRFMSLTLCVCTMSVCTASADASLILALTQNNQLIQFDSSTPGTTSGPVAVTGIGAGFHLVGIDARPATNQIYGLAVSSNSAINRL